MAQNRRIRGEAVKWAAFPFFLIGASLAFNEKSYSIGNKTALKSCEKGKDPAVVITGGKIGSFADLALVFPDGLKVRREWENSIWPNDRNAQKSKLHSRASDRRAEKYDRATRFLAVDEALRAELYDLVGKKEQVENDWREFEKEMRGNDDDFQKFRRNELEFLKSLGFTGA